MIRQIHRTRGGAVQLGLVSIGGNGGPMKPRRRGPRAKSGRKSGGQFKTRIDDDGRVCTKCGEYKPWSMFHMNSHHSTGHLSVCKACRRESSARYLATPAGKARRRKSEAVYRATPEGKATCVATFHNSRARDLGVEGTLTRDDILHKHRKTQFCPYCGKKLPPIGGRWRDRTLDHIDPMPLGTNTPDNTFICCSACNRRKQDLPLTPGLLSCLRDGKPCTDADVQEVRDWAAGRGPHPFEHQHRNHKGETDAA